MPTKERSKYVVGKRPPARLTAKAREQLENAQPSVLIAALAKKFDKLYTISSTGQISLNIPSLEALKPGDMTDVLTADEAAAASRKSSAKKNSRKSISRAK